MNTSFADIGWATVQEQTENIGHARRHKILLSRNCKGNILMYGQLGILRGDYKRR